MVRLHELGDWVGGEYTIEVEPRLLDQWLDSMGCAQRTRRLTGLHRHKIKCLGAQQLIDDFCARGHYSQVRQHARTI